MLKSIFLFRYLYQYLYFFDNSFLTDKFIKHFLVGLYKLCGTKEVTTVFIKLENLTNDEFGQPETIIPDKPLYIIYLFRSV